ncbi:MAG: hypothetical protein NZ519_05565 [Bacteroidia bacterium]|nr:hypothetical protein [Bacteroidia bacterium]MDW8348313.1 hypothetical protein [Bacteroidia bacterium]
MKKAKWFLFVLCCGVILATTSACNQEGCRGVGGKPRVHIPKHKPPGLFPKGAWGSYNDVPEISQTIVKG